MKNTIYKKGICPIAENLIAEEYLSLNFHKFDYSNQNIIEIVNAFKKVWKAFRINE